MMVRKIVLLLVAALLAVVLALPLTPAPVMANPGSQTWYMTDFASGVSGANYRMIVGSGNGSSDSLSIPASSSRVWVAASSSSADEASNIVCRMSGNWSVTLRVSGSVSNSKFTVALGVLSGGAFTQKGISAEETVGTSFVTRTVTVTTSGHTVNPSEYLALKLTPTANNKDIYLDVHDVTLSPCHVTSPATADDYPGAVTISFTLSDYGSPGVNFGDLNPGVIDQPADQNPPTQGAIILTVGTETNVPINVQLKGTDFSGPATFTLVNANVHYDDDSILDEGTETGKPQGTLTTSYVTWYSVSAYTASVVQCYHWITVPAGQTAGDYTATFYYQAVPQ